MSVNSVLTELDSLFVHHGIKVQWPISIPDRESREPPTSRAEGQELKHTLSFKRKHIKKGIQKV